MITSSDIRTVRIPAVNRYAGHRMLIPAPVLVGISDDEEEVGSRKDRVPSIILTTPTSTTHMTWDEAQQLIDALTEVLGVAVNG